MKTIELHITLQPQVLDTQGQALKQSRSRFRLYASE